MPDPRTANRITQARRESVVWIDRHRAVIIQQGRRSAVNVEVLDRLSSESTARFGARTVERVIDHDRVVVAGPSDARTAFERAYVAVTHRPDWLMDTELSVVA